MTWNVFQAYVQDAQGNRVASPTVTVTRASDGATVSLASDIAGTGQTNPFTGGSDGLLRFYAQAGRYNVTVASGAFSAVFANVLLGSASGADIGSANDNVPSVAIGNTLWERVVLNNYGATSAPLATDDDGDGYSVGSIWVDNSASPIETFLCIDATTGSAVWISVNLTLGDIGSMALQDANAVNITGGTITGITALAVADGGTGGTTQATARAGLGIGTAGTADSTDFASAAQGALAASAVQPGNNITLLVNDAGYITSAPTPVFTSVDATAEATWRGRPVIVDANATITLPEAATYNAPIGFTFDVMARTVGPVNVVVEGTDELLSTTGGAAVAITDENGWCSVMKIAAGKWSVVGQIEAVSI